MADAACPRCGRPLDDLEPPPDDRRQAATDDRRQAPPGDRRCPRCGLRLPDAPAGGPDRGLRVAFLGFGLIGGSVARALRGAGWTDLVAWSPSGDGPAAAVADGVLRATAGSPEEAIADAELVLLAAPPLRCLDLIDGLAGPWREALPADATVTDVASTKAAVVARADGVGLRFVGGHPMAGREVTGYEASREDLFAGRPWVVVPGRRAGDRDVERVERLVAAVAARPLPMRAAEHDAIVAAISHLPLVASAALVESVSSWAERRSDPGAPARLAASGWRDATRLALGDPAMGAGILATNSDAVRALVERLRDVLAGWSDELAAPDAAGLERRLAQARARLAAMREAADPEEPARGDDAGESVAG